MNFWICWQFPVLGWLCIRKLKKYLQTITNLQGRGRNKTAAERGSGEDHRLYIHVASNIIETIENFLKIQVFIAF